MEQATGSDEFQSQGGGLADSVNLVDVYLSLRVRHVIQTASETKTKMLLQTRRHDGTLRPSSS